MQDEPIQRPSSGELEDAVREVPRTEAGEIPTSSPAHPPRRTLFRRALPVLVVGMVASLSWGLRTAQRPVVEPSMETRVVWARAHAFEVIRVIESAAGVEGELPSSLEGLSSEFELAGVEYARLPGESYTLTVSDDAASVTYTRGEDLGPYESAYRSMVPGGGGASAQSGVSGS